MEVNGNNEIFEILGRKNKNPRRQTFRVYVKMSEIQFKLASLTQNLTLNVHGYITRNLCLQIHVQSISKFVIGYCFDFFLIEYAQLFSVETVTSINKIHCIYGGIDTHITKKKK